MMTSFISHDQRRRAWRSPHRPVDVFKEWLELDAQLLRHRISCDQAESEPARHDFWLFQRPERGPRRSSILRMKVVDGRDRLGAKDLIVAPPLELRVAAHLRPHAPLPHGRTLQARGEPLYRVTAAPSCSPVPCAPSAVLRVRPPRAASARGLVPNRLVALHWAGPTWEIGRAGKGEWRRSSGSSLLHAYLRSVQRQRAAPARHLVERSTGPPETTKPRRAGLRDRTGDAAARAQRPSAS